MIKVSEEVYGEYKRVERMTKSLELELGAALKEDEVQPLQGAERDAVTNQFLGKARVVINARQALWLKIKEEYPVKGQGLYVIREDGVLTELPGRDSWLPYPTGEGVAM